MIRKVSAFKDEGINRQFDEIISNQFSNYKEVIVTFTSPTAPLQVDIGFRADRFIVVDDDTGISGGIKRTSSDNRYMTLVSTSGAGTVTLKVWKTS
jgi:hypothetical protein